MRKNRISLNHVRDRIYAQEGDEELELRVDDDSMAMARRIKRVLDDIEKAKQDPDGMEKAAMNFAKAIFGNAQTEKLYEFYSNNPYSVMEFTSKYFTGRLSAKIVKAQRHVKVI